MHSLHVGLQELLFLEASGTYAAFQCPQPQVIFHMDPVVLSTDEALPTLTAFKRLHTSVSIFMLLELVPVMVEFVTKLALVNLDSPDFLRFLFLLRVAVHKMTFELENRVIFLWTEGTLVAPLDGVTEPMMTEVLGILVPLPTYITYERMRVVGPTVLLK